MAAILCIETSTTNCSVAIGINGKLITVVERDEGYSHAELLTIFIQQALEESQLKLSEIDAIAVGKGPGSYTGLRIGVSTVKGLCYAQEKPLIAVDTLKSMHSFPAGSDESVLYAPMLDARRMEVYCAFYDNRGQQVRKVSADIIDENSYLDLLQEHTVFFYGPGMPKCREILNRHSNARFIENVVPSAAGMIPLAEEARLKNNFEDVAYFEPFYLKDFMATTPKKRI